jgi:hypothetical protein
MRVTARLYKTGLNPLKIRLKRLFCFDQVECEGLPLVCVGAEKSFMT